MSEELGFCGALIVVAMFAIITLPMASVQIVAKNEIMNRPILEVKIDNSTIVKKHYGDFIANVEIFSGCSIEGKKLKCVLISPSGNMALNSIGSTGNDAWVASTLAQTKVSAHCKTEPNSKNLHECVTEPPPVVKWWLFLGVDIFLILCTIICGIGGLMIYFK